MPSQYCLRKSLYRRQSDSHAKAWRFHTSTGSTLETEIVRSCPAITSWANLFLGLFHLSQKRRSATGAFKLLVFSSPFSAVHTPENSSSPHPLSPGENTNMKWARSPITTRWALWFLKTCAKLLFWETTITGHSGRIAIDIYDFYWNSQTFAPLSSGWGIDDFLGIVYYILWLSLEFTNICSTIFRLLYILITQVTFRHLYIILCKYKILSFLLMLLILPSSMICALGRRAYQWIEVLLCFHCHIHTLPQLNSQFTASSSVNLPILIHTPTIFSLLSSFTFTFTFPSLSHSLDLEIECSWSLSPQILYSHSNTPHCLPMPQTHIQHMPCLSWGVQFTMASSFHQPFCPQPTMEDSQGHFKSAWVKTLPLHQFQQHIHH